MQPKLEQLKTEALLAIKAVKDKMQLEELENKLLGRKSGQLTELMKELKDLGDEARKEAGKLANEVKQAIENEFNKKRTELSSAEWGEMVEKERVDITQPALPKKEQGHFHPVTSVQKDLENLFTSMGFMVLDGPELESDYYNFTALNIPETHPARDMQDTFYIKGHSPSSAKATAGTWVMRTHTSPMQVRAMQKYGAPLRVVIPGRCFRNEATDPRHEHTLYQMEALVVDKGINLSHLKGLLEVVAKYLYGSETKLRLRPKFYPFVEPGVNGEVTCFLCKGAGGRACKESGWLED